MRKFNGQKIASLVAMGALMLAPLFARAQSITYPGALVSNQKTLGALNAAAPVTANFGLHSCTINLGAGLVGTTTFEVASDQAGTAFAAYAFTPQSGGAAVSTTTAAGVWQATFVGPITACEAVVTAYTSGSAVVTVAGAANPGANAGGSSATPIPYPTLGVNVLNTPGVNVANTSLPVTAATTFPVFPQIVSTPFPVTTAPPPATPTPCPTNGTTSACVVTIAVGSTPLPVVTPPPFSGAVTGTFWQAIQPIALPTSFQAAFPTPIPVPTCAAAVPCVQLTGLPNPLPVTTPVPAPTNTAGIPTVACVNGCLATPVPTAPAVQATVAASTSSVTLLTAGAATHGWTICNASSAILATSKVSPASLTLFWEQFPAQATVAQCQTEVIPWMFTGAVYGIWASATGYAAVTYW